MQLTPPPQVTAEGAPWYLSGEPILWNGELYYPAGVTQFFNRYQMVRAGYFRGTPLYTDVTLEPNSILFVPLSSERMQPYERPRTGELAGTSGSRAPSFPIGISAEVTPLTALNQPLTTPAPAFDRSSPAPQLVTPGPTDASPLAVSQPKAVGTSGRAVVTQARGVTTARPPTGANSIWIDYDGRRWVSAGKAIAYDAATLTQVGTYHGWSVYTRNGDRTTIYVAAIPGKLSPYRVR